MSNILGDVNYEDLYRQCMQFSHNITMVLSDKLTVLDINPHAERILKWRKQDVLNQSIMRLFETTGIKPFIDEVPATKQKKVTHVPRKTSSIKIFWTIVPHFDENNQLDWIGVFGKPAPEMTDKELRIQLENVIKYAPGLFYWKDKNSVYQGGNEEFALSAGLESWMQVKGKTDFELAWRDRAEQYVNIDKQVIESGQAHLNHEEQITTINNKTMIAITNKVPLFDKKNRVIGLMGITTDITHQKEVEQHLKLAKEQAEIANRVKSEFIENMSHDIRTPLSGIVGISQVLKERVISEEEKQYVQWISDCGQQLLSLLNGILEVVSADNVSEKDLRLESFNLFDCVQDIIHIGQPSTKLKGLALTMCFGEGVPEYIISDRTKLHRVLLNLLGNAIKFTDAGAVHIDVRLLKRDGDQVTLQFQVVDTGIGIPQELQDKVFDRFFRASPSYKGQYEGHGVGLHIAASYIELLGGTIKLSSQLGRGTTFYFELVFTIGQETPHRQVSPSDFTPSFPIKTPSTQRTRPVLNSLSDNAQNSMVVLVEDNEIARRVMECLMSDMNIAFTSCLDAESAFSLLQTNSYRLLITDIGLPGISGNDLATRVRAWEKNTGRSPMPIIGLTAHAQGRIREECLRAGMTDVFSKPMQVATLKMICDSYLHPHNTGVTLNEIELFDVFSLLQSVNDDERFAKEMIRTLLWQDIPQLKTLIQHAHLEKNRQNIQASVHKMKSSAMYCKTKRLQQVCQMLEDRLLSTDQSESLDALYALLSIVIEDTEGEMIRFLDSTL